MRKGVYNTSGQVATLPTRRRRPDAQPKKVL